MISVAVLGESCHKLSDFRFLTPPSGGTGRRTTLRFKREVLPLEISTNTEFERSNPSGYRVTGVGKSYTETAIPEVGVVVATSGRVRRTRNSS